MDKQRIDVLDHGFVRLIDVMGTDDSVVQAARVSYGDGTKTVNTDRNLIRYLMRHEHTTPFEMCEVKFHIKYQYSLCDNLFVIVLPALMSIVVDIL